MTRGPRMKTSTALASLLLLISTTAFGWAGEWQDDERLASIQSGAESIFSVKLDVYNMADNPEGRNACGDVQCYRVDVFVNNTQVATWATSPGKPQADGGSYSPLFSGERIFWAFGRDYVSYTKRYHMKYAMYIERVSQPGTISNIAFHGGYKVTGKRESHGCFRLRDSEAALLNHLVRKAFDDSGSVQVWSEGTRPPFKD